MYKTFENLVILTIKTKKPEKWLLIDRETGEVYQGNPDGYWDKMIVYKKEKQHE